VFATRPFAAGDLPVVPSGAECEGAKEVCLVAALCGWRPVHGPTRELRYQTTPLSDQPFDALGRRACRRSRGRRNGGAAGELPQYRDTIELEAREAPILGHRRCRPNFFARSARTASTSATNTIVAGCAAAVEDVPQGRRRQYASKEHASMAAGRAGGLRGAESRQQCHLISLLSHTAITEAITHTPAARCGHAAITDLASHIIRTRRASK
jgi:hypothetical protein